LPGLTGAIGLAFLSPSVQRIFDRVVDEQNLALGLMGALAAIALGLFLTLFRTVLVEEILWRSSRLTADEHAELITNEDTFRAYRNAVDESYRYHQFWGGMALAILILLVGIIYRRSTTLDESMEVVLFIAAIVTEIAALWATVQSYRRYLERVRLLLEK
jgi:Na+/citrate or Na+/malate symporter